MDLKEGFELDKKQLGNIEMFFRNLSKEKQQELSTEYQDKGRNLEARLRNMIKNETPSQESLASRLAEKPIIIIAHCDACSKSGNIEHYKQLIGARSTLCVHLKTTVTALSFWIEAAIDFATRVRAENMQSCNALTLSREVMNSIPVTSCSECLFNVSFIFCTKTVTEPPYLSTP